MKDYLVYGTRYSKFLRIFDWIEDHCDARLVSTNYKLHKEGKYDRYQSQFTEHKYFSFPEMSLVYNEDLMLCRNTTNYTRSIVMLRDIFDVIEDVVRKTHKSTDKAVGKQVDLFEEFAEEFYQDSHKIPSNHRLFINYNLWLSDVEYRDSLGVILGFSNEDHVIHVEPRDFEFRKKLRYMKYATSHLKRLNKLMIYTDDNSLYL